MAIAPSAIGLKKLLEALANSQSTITQINQICAEKDLPPVFSFNEQGDPDISDNPDYRFEGFGAVIGLPPKISFWVHYKPGTPDHVEIGRFTVPVGFGKA
ncbi:MAG: hypothetical protein AAF152_15230 [Cyanobacteria bacterium P01_A01_bin.114]